MFTTSATKIERFRACPHQYKHEPFTSSPATEFGNAIHASVAAMLSTGEDPMNVFKRECAARKLDISTLDRAKAIFDGAFDHHRLNLNSESCITIESADGEATYYGRKFFEVKASDAWVLRGAMDYVDVTPDGAIRVIDWKTGQTSRDDDVQLACYAIAARLKYDLAPVETAFYYLEKKQYDGRLWTAEQLASAFDYVDGIVRQMIEAEKAGSFPQTPHKNCRCCSLRDGCEAFAKQIAGKPDRPEWELDATLENLPEIQKRIEQLDSIAKAAYAIHETLKERREEILRANGGSASFDGRTLTLKERTTAYDYNLPVIFAGIQEIIGRPPIEICKYHAGGLDELVKPLDAATKKAIRAMATGNRMPAGKTAVVTCAVAKENVQAIEEDAADDAAA